MIFAKPSSGRKKKGTKSTRVMIEATLPLGFLSACLVMLRFHAAGVRLTGVQIPPRLDQIVRQGAIHWGGADRTGCRMDGWRRFWGLCSMQILRYGEIPIWGGVASHPDSPAEEKRGLGTEIDVAWGKMRCLLTRTSCKARAPYHLFKPLIRRLVTDWVHRYPACRRGSEFEGSTPCLSRGIAHLAWHTTHEQQGGWEVVS